MGDLKFVGLHAHSTFSIGDAIGYPKDHFDFAIENGMDAMALTEHGNMNCAGYMVQAAEGYEKKGIPFKPIYGVEAYIHPSLEEWQKLKESKNTEEVIEQEVVVENESESKSKYYDPLKRRHHIVLLAQNQQGMQNIFRMISKSYREGFYRFPRIDFEMLKNNNEGVLVSTACLAGLPSWLILKEHEKGEEAAQNLLRSDLFPLMEIFGKDRFFLEIQFNKMQEQRIVNDHIIKFANETGYNLIAAADSHYANPDWWKERELYRMLAQQSKGWNKDKNELPERVEDLKCELYPKNGNQMYESYKKMYGSDSNPELDGLVKEAIERTYSIAHDQIGTITPDSSFKLPRVDFSPFEKLKNLCIEKMEEKGFDEKDEYVERLATELNIIRDKKFAIYFITLKDAIDTIKTKMLVGPARGSGAGSLVCYLLGITQLDPIKNGLLFERFLSEHRKGAPDIDTDIEDKELCLSVLKEKFGEDNVVSVSNFNTLQLKSLVKDLGKFYDIPFMEVNEVTTKMEQEARPKILKEIGGDQKLYVFDLDGAKKHSETFQEFIKKYPKVEESINVLFRQIKTIGRHAGGVIICHDAESCMPVIRMKKVDQTPWTEGMAAKHLEQFGLIKYDFLGLATLRFIRKCIQLILKEQGKDPSIENVYGFYNENLHPDVMDPRDEKVFSYVYHFGRFPGIFQFTESGAQNFCKRAMPDSVQEISALTSIYRPGPLSGDVDKLYVDAKKEESIEYEHPILEELLGETFGFIVYQEQFMMLANKLAGFTLAESDKLRKLLVRPETSLSDQVKKEREEIAEKFIKGCVENGISQERAEKLWHKEILGFISYGFNKSHAMAYAYISYQCAWLLTYHEKEWVRAYLEMDDDRDKAIEDVSAIGYTVEKPNIMKSEIDWRLEENKLFPSLVNIKGVGDVAAEELVELRKKDFKDFYDFIYDFSEKHYKNGKIKIKRNWRFSKFNKRALSAMIKLEAFDDFDIVGPGKVFETYRHMHDVFIENWDKIKRGSVDIAELAKETEPKEWSVGEIVEFQKDLTGTFDKFLLVEEKTLRFFRDNDILPISDISEDPHYHWFILKSKTKKNTKNGKPYFKLVMMDIDGTTKNLNYFGQIPDDGLEKNKIYIALLHLNNSWINVPFGNKIMKASK